MNLITIETVHDYVSIYYKDRYYCFLLKKPSMTRILCRFFLERFSKLWRNNAAHH